MSLITLAIVEGNGAGREVPVEATIVLGRDPRNDLVLDDPVVSARHASIDVANGAVSVHDLGSLSGTFVNGRRLTAPQPLQPGDRIRVGGTVFEVRAGAAAARPTEIGVGRARLGPAPPVLVFVGGPAAGVHVPVVGPMVAGRESTVDLVLDDEEVSRRHATFALAGAGLTIQDLGSTNGTLVNGERLTGIRVLADADRIELGRTTIQVRLPGYAPAPPPAPAAPAPVAPPAPAAPVTELPAPVAAPAVAAAAADNGIEVEGLIKEFGKDLRAVDGIDLHVEPGEIYGFLGPNGAGKSTTVHMLTTLLPPSGGTARVAGYDIVRQGVQVRASIGVALQAAALDPMLNAWEHMKLQAALQGIPRAQRRQRAEELLERVGLTDAAGRRVGGYSGGMKRRLDLALALVHLPRVLFLDEPTTGLDPQSRTALWEEVARLAKDEGMTVFLTTQYLEEADVLADEISIIDHGEIVARGTPSELKAEIGRPTVEAVPADLNDWGAVAEVLQQFGKLSTAAHRGVAVRLDRGVDDLAEVVRALDARGLRVANLELHAPTLDDVFLAKTGRTLEGAGEAGSQEAPAPEAQQSGVEQLSNIAIPVRPGRG